MVIYAKVKRKESPKKTDPSLTCQVLLFGRCYNTGVSLKLVRFQGGNILYMQTLIGLILPPLLEILHPIES